MKPDTDYDPLKIRARSITARRNKLVRVPSQSSIILDAETRVPRFRWAGQGVQHRISRRMARTTFHGSGYR